ncbi:MAG: hypothetical protein IPO36_06625 [Anaerolineales bacterium]|nr:hypothetical protein [Anaerolineales bacterium]
MVELSVIIKELQLTLNQKYPPSKPCGCKICLAYCARPGWWTVEEASRAMEAGYGNRMMLEIAPELTFGVLSPAFKGCEKFYATEQFSRNGCTFLKEDRCELYGTGHQPLECRFCHHERRGLGLKCHAALEKDWKTPDGQVLVERWIRQVGLRDRLFMLSIMTTH